MHYRKYPIRICRSSHYCNLCFSKILLSEKYYDGGYDRRVHLICNDIFGAAEFVKWMRNRPGYNHLTIKTYQDGEPYFSCQGAEISLRTFWKSNLK